MKRKIIMGMILITICVIFNLSISNAESDNITMQGNIDSNNNITFSIQASEITGFNGNISFEDEVLEYIGVEEKNDSNINVDTDKWTISGVLSNSNNTTAKEIAVLKFKAKETQENITEGVYIIDLKILKTNGDLVDNLKIGDTVSINNDSNTLGEFEDDPNAEITDGEAVDETGNVVAESTVIDQTGITVTYEGDKANTNGYQENTINPNTITDAKEAENTSEDGIEILAKKDEAGKLEEEKFGDKTSNDEDEGYFEDENKQQTESLSNDNIPQTGLAITIVPITIAIVLLIIGCFAYKKSKEN